MMHEHRVGNFFECMMENFIVIARGSLVPRLSRFYSITTHKEGNKINDKRCVTLAGTSLVGYIDYRVRPGTEAK